jgi:signal transduction histidine kinase
MISFAAAACSDSGSQKSLFGAGDELQNLENRVEEIDRTLSSLALESMVGGVGSVGSESKMHAQPNNTEWFQVDWKTPALIDQIVLVPMIFLTSQDYTAGGFPLEFRVLAGTPQDPKGIEIASFGEQDHLLPRSVPLVIPCHTTASWVRIEATKLSPRLDSSEEFVLRLAELIAFSGGTNMAQGATATSSSTGNQEGERRNLSALTDGHLPYSMNAPGDKSFAFVAENLAGETTSITIDLGATHPVTEINFHALEPNSTSPGGIWNDAGIPGQFSIEGANRGDFSDAIELAVRRKAGPFDCSPILRFKIPETPCRYVRLSTTNSRPYSQLVAFAEIEILSHDRNISVGKSVQVQGAFYPRRPESLTDGTNTYGRILSLRKWMDDLALRHDLQTELPLLRQRIQQINEQQRRNLAGVTWIAGLSLVGGAFALLAFQLVKIRQLASLRARFAADLHDELGANLESIGMLAELAREDMHAPKKLEGTIGEIQDLIEDTRATARHCIDKQQHPMQINLAQDIRNLSTRILADIEWDLQITGEKYLQRLKPIFLDDLMLFYKECLMNVSRHSDATQVRARLEADKRTLTLQVEDNGKGLQTGAPKSLQRRAKLLGGKVTSARASLGGTRITLTCRLRRLPFFSVITGPTKKTP